ncbi:MAG: FAD:protein FMN transferase [Saprospiraceae bacterium]|nr:FAD:protein FMN transferase [Saprospiraceae bacterium]
MRVLLFFIIISICACKPDTSTSVNEPITFSKITGSTMGTSYTIQCDLNDPALKYQIDSILVDINSHVSTYEPESHISKVNKNLISQTESVDGLLKMQFEAHPHFDANFERSKEIFEQTDGYFDPTVMLLVNYWGFGYTPKQRVTTVDSTKIKLILTQVGFEKWTYNKTASAVELTKPESAEIDFSAIAKGYAVDYLSQYLNKKGARNFMVEIGGEVFTKGKNSKGSAWTIGLNTPADNAPVNAFVLLVQLSDKALASSGNYRNFYISNGKKYAHEINPKSGFPEINALLGVSVIANNCMDADAYATAFMVMGLESSKRKVEEIKDLEACFFYSDDQGQIQYDLSSGFKPYIKS